MVTLIVINVHAVGFPMNYFPSTNTTAIFLWIQFTIDPSKQSSRQTLWPSIYLLTVVFCLKVSLTRILLSSRDTRLNALVVLFGWTSLVNGQYVPLITITQSTHAQHLFSVLLLVASAVAMCSTTTNSELTEAKFQPIHL